MIDVEKALLDPVSVFDTPTDVVDADGLTDQQKIEILKRWAYDSEELQIAEDEGMPGRQPGRLQEVRRLIDALKVIHKRSET